MLIYKDIYFALGVDKHIRIWYTIIMARENKIKNTEGNNMRMNSNGGGDIIFEHPPEVVLSYGHNPYWVGVNISFLVTKELTSIMKNVRGVNTCSNGPAMDYRYTFWFTYGPTFKRENVEKRIEAAIREFAIYRNVSINPNDINGRTEIKITERYKIGFNKPVAI